MSVYNKKYVFDMHNQNMIFNMTCYLAINQHYKHNPDSFNKADLCKKKKC